MRMGAKEKRQRAPGWLPTSWQRSSHYFYICLGLHCMDAPKFIHQFPLLDTWILSTLLLLQTRLCWLTLYISFYICLVTSNYPERDSLKWVSWIKDIQVFQAIPNSVNSDSSPHKGQLCPGYEFAKKLKLPLQELSQEVSLHSALEGNVFLW